jgi:hypothetical protein
LHPQGLTVKFLSRMIWARSALDGTSEIPMEVVRELRQRCPGYLNERGTTPERNSKNTSNSWDGFMMWIAEHFFTDAQGGGWFEVILGQVRNHPRAIRTMEYADRCDELWEFEVRDPYPPFQQWRKAADAYVETSACEKYSIPISQPYPSVASSTSGQCFTCLKNQVTTRWHRTPLGEVKWVCHAKRKRAMPGCNHAEG